MHRAKVLVNAGGPWVEEVIRNVARIDSTEGVRLVRGSHIVTRTGCSTMTAAISFRARTGGSSLPFPTSRISP
jgi:glycerol-3-phosphate dehydrogenase